jgi:ADP-ribose pyrophosphatase YjhB (NUDIX family)
MSNLWKGLRRIAAERTGVPTASEEDVAVFDNPKSGWVIFIAIIVAAVALLQMDTERSRAGNEKKAWAGNASTFLPG